LYFICHQQVDVQWAVLNLDDLSVIVTERPVALVMPPLQLHAVITLETSVHVGGPMWSAPSMPAALERMEHILSKIIDATAEDNHRARFAYILRFARHTIPRFNMFVENYRSATQLLPHAQEQVRMCAVRLERVHAQLVTLEELRSFGASDKDQ
jgi:hypothetical protein